MPPKRKAGAEGKSEGEAGKRGRKSAVVKEETETKSTKKIKKSGAVKEEDVGPVMKSVTVKGLAPVDTECPVAGSHHVHTESGEVWDATLNQTNIQNNNNKFYIVQLLAADLGQGYGLWTRWGRVGKVGQSRWEVTGGLEEAKRIFRTKFQDKTRNCWDDRANFEKVSGKYDMVAVDYCQDRAGSAVKQELKQEEPSSLPPQVQELVSLVCSLRTMETAVMELQYDTRKAPLGKLTKEQITAGYRALQQVADLVEKGRTSGADLVEACNHFYTRIPHDFGMKTPPLVRSREEVKLKLQLLEALGDIQVALKLLGGLQGEGSLVDQKYLQLGVVMEPLTGGPVRKLLERSILSTHASTHSQYSMAVEQVFSLTKPRETEHFRDCGHRQLLFHGSRLSNWAGILSQGLRIAPPEAPATGYMFGKGVYFADMSSKAANYCFPTRTQPYGLLLVCEVARGKARKLVAADSGAARLPKGCSSVVGLGRVEPSEQAEVPGLDGLALPMGPGRETR